MEHKISSSFNSTPVVDHDAVNYQVGTVARTGDGKHWMVTGHDTDVRWTQLETGYRGSHERSRSWLGAGTVILPGGTIITITVGE